MTNTAWRRRENLREGGRFLTIEVREPSPRPACIPPCYVRLAARELKGTGVKVATVVSFPFGNDTTAVKVAAVGMRSWAAPPNWTWS